MEFTLLLYVTNSGSSMVLSYPRALPFPFSEPYILGSGGMRLGNPLLGPLWIYTVFVLCWLLRLLSQGLYIWWVMQHPPDDYGWIIYYHPHIGIHSPLLFFFPLWPWFIPRLLSSIPCLVNIDILVWKWYWSVSSTFILQLMPLICDQYF